MSVRNGTFIAATGWTPAVLLETANDQARMTRVAGNNSGNLIATWEQYDDVQGTVTVFAALYTPNVGWSIAQQISSPTNNGGDAEVVMDRDGNATAVWVESVRGQYNTSYIVAGRYRPSLGWVTQQLESNEEYTDIAAHPVLALDPHGNVTAVWRHSTSIPGTISLPPMWIYSVVADRYTVFGSGSPSNQPPTANAGTAQTWTITACHYI